MIYLRAPRRSGVGSYRVVPAVSSQLRVRGRGLGAMVACPLEYVSNDGQCCNFIDDFGDCIAEGPGQTITAADGSRRQIFDGYEIRTDAAGRSTVVQTRAAAKPPATRTPNQPGGAPFDATAFINEYGGKIALGFGVFAGLLLVTRMGGR